jgi:hypothetical protein
MDETATTNHAERRLAVSIFVPAEIASTVCMRIQNYNAKDQRIKVFFDALIL